MGLLRLWETFTSRNGHGLLNMGVFAMANGSDEVAPVGWMSDVQRALALLLIGLLVAAAAALVVRLVISGDVKDILDLAKIMLAALVNMGLIALGFFFGNTMAKMASDAGQQKVVEKLTSTAPVGTPGPVAPMAGPTVVVVAWWSKLTDMERAAITAAAPADPKAASFMAAAQTGVATEDDLKDLVDKGLLTQARADAIKSA